MKQDTPFLYQHLLDRIVDAGPNWPRVMIWGGSGLGKSHFLDLLREEFDALGPCPAKLIRRRMPRAKQQILSWTQSPVGTLLIDDLDRLFDPEIEKALLSLPEEADSWRLIAAAGSLQPIKEQTSIDGSPVLNTFQRERLDPWEGNWERRLESALWNAYEKARAGAEVSGGGLAFSKLDENSFDVLDIWIQCTVDLSGGHPALVNAAFAGLLGLLSREISEQAPARLSLLEKPSSKVAAWKRKIANFIEDQILEHGGLDAIDRNIQLLQKQPESFKFLVKLAQSARRPPAIKNPGVRYALRDSGLVHSQSTTGHHVVVGKLVRKRILEFHRISRPESKVDHEAVILNPNQDLPLEQGTLEWFSEPEGAQKLNVQGVSWKLLACMAETRGEPVSLDHLQECAELGGPKATRSGIKRLRDFLEENGLDGLVENVHGLGYQLI